VHLISTVRDVRSGDAWRLTATERIDFPNLLHSSPVERTIELTGQVRLVRMEKDVELNVSLLDSNALVKHVDVGLADVQSLLVFSNQRCHVHVGSITLVFVALQITVTQNAPNRRHSF